ncbi:glucosaminidase domain-containing protein [Bacteroides sp. 51]|uniref:glucosaminidase domain-containing protein n=1 Tax=Bacteroides sp. 51 TaxID=2302938 RepID=UPI0013D1A45E|nr:glucosaminidase domain-containing protein [Bacteroides sp. 51]NDV84776.1 glucosaminidase [Bacteroides sp. 51]
MSKNQEYAEKHAEYAMDQMRRYGIPASVTLAQGILESSNGQSQLARNENNHFGIKATQSWIAGGGKYGLYTDDKPNEKFCSYGSVGSSYEHHSQFFKENQRYAGCFKLSPDDYGGWAKGLEKAGYATGGKYASSLISIIEKNDLQNYDQMVMAEMKAKGQTFGMEQNPRTINSNIVDTIGSNKKESGSYVAVDGNYSFPVKRNEFLLVTSPFGMRKDPLDSSKQQMHKGIDIQTKRDDVLATENHGKVVAVNQNAHTAAGKSVTLEYQRENGDKCQINYLHLSSIDVKIGDEVNAGQKIGISGNTGTRTTGEHLHFGVKQITANGVSRDIDPAAYLAEIGQIGNIQLQTLLNGTDLLAKYKEAAPGKTPQIDTTLSSEDWMKKLLSSEDSGVSMSSGDPIMELITTLFTSLMALAVQIDNKSEEEKMQVATDSAINKQVDLSTLMPSLKECRLSIQENGKALLHMNDEKNEYIHELGTAEMNRLQGILGNSGLSDADKQQRIAGMVNNALLTKQTSRNYEQNSSQQEIQNLQIR